MERYGRSFRDNNNNKVREPWSYNHGYLGGADSLSSGLLGGFSWPPRSYTCSFCRREFRSAQALGGHMNVHRRDRARLRRSPPWDPPLCNPSTDLNPNPNPNPSPKPNPLPNLNISPPSSPSSTLISPVTYTFPSLLSPLTRLSSSTSSAEHFCLKGEKDLFGEFKGFVEEDTADMMRSERGAVRLDLEIGMCGVLEEDLDLELRLGNGLMQSPIMKSYSAGPSSPLEKSEAPCSPIKPDLHRDGMEREISHNNPEGMRSEMEDHHSHNKKEGLDYGGFSGELLGSSPDEAFNNGVDSTNNPYEETQNENFSYQGSKSPTFDETVDGDFVNVSEHSQFGKSIDEEIGAGNPSFHTEMKKDFYPSGMESSDNRGIVRANSGVHSPQRTQSGSPSPERQTGQ